jgi:peptide/nickel transport system permease protein
MVTRGPVLDEFLRRAPVTLELALIAMVFALAAGLPLGILAGVVGPDHKGGLIARLIGALGASVPEFVLGSLLIFVFSVWSLWFKVGGYVGPL